MRKEVDKKFIEAFGKNLRKIRLQQGISMQNLAYTINVEYSQIRRIEHGKINTSINTVQQIATALELPIQDFFNFNI